MQNRTTLAEVHDWCEHDALADQLAARQELEEIGTGAARASVAEILDIAKRALGLWDCKCGSEPDADVVGHLEALAKLESISAGKVKGTIEEIVGLASVVECGGS